MKTFNEFSNNTQTPRKTGKTKFTLNQLKNYFDGHTIVVVSADHDGSDENKFNTAALEQKIKATKYAYEPAVGGYVEDRDTDHEKYVDKKKSFVIVDVNQRGGLKKFGVKMGITYDQDSILLADANNKAAYFIGTTHRKDAKPAFGKKDKIGTPRWGAKGLYYTKIKDGYFTFGNE